MILLGRANIFCSQMECFFLRPETGNNSEADITLYTDACLSGMGVFCPDLNLGFWGVFDGPLPSEWIYYRELWATVTAIEFAVVLRELKGKRIVVFTDNSNTVDAFNTLAIDPTYNRMLMFAVDLLIKSDCQLRVLHIPGVQNNIADALSRRELERVMRLCPGLTINQISPPRDALGPFCNEYMPREGPPAVGIPSPTSR
jgi:hypothetical protein